MVWIQIVTLVVGIIFSTIMCDSIAKEASVPRMQATIIVTIFLSLFVAFYWFFVESAIALAKQVGG